MKTRAKHQTYLRNAPNTKATTMTGWSYSSPGHAPPLIPTDNGNTRGRRSAHLLRPARPQRHRGSRRPERLDSRSRACRRELRARGRVLPVDRFLCHRRPARFENRHYHHHFRHFHYYDLESSDRLGLRPDSALPHSVDEN